ncbi:MAG: shikimate kinase [Cytophagaceae bacterium]|nr:shikimate kinase [Cytophagaceae bacterium]MDW8456263.1 shikimate kinase [Cytophagaceae bacterium]
MDSTSSIFLVGMPGCGKTTLGKQYAHYSGRTYVDTDKMITEQQGMTIEEIYAKGGEIHFRELEYALLDHFAHKKNMVIGTGGGLPTYKDNMDKMNRMGITVFMDVSPEELWNRLQHTDFSGRPIYQNKTPEQIRETIKAESERRRVYYSKAHITLKSDDIQLVDLLEALARL